MKFKTIAVVSLVAGLHVLGLGAFLLIQGCQTARRPDAPPPTAPVMPPRPVEPADVPPVAPAPVFHPPVEVPTAPAHPDWDAMHSYTVRGGDTLSSIAQRHGVSTRELADLNQLDDPDTIRVGQKLMLPAHARATPAPRPAAPRAPEAATVAPGETYEVRAGDVLSRIAVRHGTTVKALQEANNLRDPNDIRVGQKLVIPGTRRPAAETAPRDTAPAREPAPPEPARIVPEPQPDRTAPAAERSERQPSEQPFMYRVVEGDTLDSVAQAFSILRSDLARANNLREDEEILPGQRLAIPTERSMDGL